MLTPAAVCSCPHLLVQIHVTADGSSAVRVPGNKSVIDVLKSLGDYQTFLLALQVCNRYDRMATCSAVLEFRKTVTGHLRIQHGSGQWLLLAVRLFKDKSTILSRAGPIAKSCQHTEHDTQFQTAVCGGFCSWSIQCSVFAWAVTLFQASSPNTCSALGTCSS